MPELCHGARVRLLRPDHDEQGYSAASTQLRRNSAPHPHSPSSCREQFLHSPPMRTGRNSTRTQALSSAMTFSAAVPNDREEAPPACPIFPPTPDHKQPRWNHDFPTGPARYILCRYSGQSGAFPAAPQRSLLYVPVDSARTACGAGESDGSAAGFDRLLGGVRQVPPGERHLLQPPFAGRAEPVVIPEGSER